jgi:hypothetical protein
MRLFLLAFLSAYIAVVTGSTEEWLIDSDDE